jgi:hypothetical protein
LTKRISENILNEVEEYFKISLNKKSELKLIINSFQKSNNLSGFENLCFTGKYLNGLFKVLRDSPNLPDVKSVDQIKKDISDNIENITGQLREVSLGLNKTDKKNIEDNYLQLSQYSLQNIQVLIEDLDQIKKYLNFLKREVSN